MTGTRRPRPTRLRPRSTPLAGGTRREWGGGGSRASAPVTARWWPPDAADDAERGDVPGWVLVTLMTAGLVIALWAVAGPALVDVFNSAIERVTSVG